MYFVQYEKTLPPWYSGTDKIQAETSEDAVNEFYKHHDSFEEFNPEINEKTEYYLDTSQDNTEKYVAYDGSYWYTGKIGIRGGDRYLKFAATHGKNSYFERAKLKKTTPEKLEKDVGFTVDFKKLYKR